MSDIDEVDRQIVDLLIEDGRMPCAEIARRLGSVSERVVRYRIGRLVTSGIIHIGAIANPRSLGYQVVADVFLQVDAASVLDVARRLAEYECISYVGSSMGETDISAQVVAHDTAEVYAFVTEVIANIPGVRKASTVIVPMVLKDIYEWRIPNAVLPGRASPDSGGQGTSGTGGSVSPRPAAKSAKQTGGPARWQPPAARQP